MDPSALDHFAHEAVDSAIAVHRALGPELLETACQACLAYELRKRGTASATQVAMPVTYDNQRLDIGALSALGSRFLN